ncbi:MAG TPA: YncE family protein [Janthinobacterium sp.]|jgi:YVTN family beta-propeller protein|nr:YncE family protein [Janthinobacterium sp.]
MKSTLKLSLLACALVASSASLHAQTAAAPLTLLSTTPLPHVSGGDFDHFAVDLAHSLMYVPTETYGSIEVFSLPDGRHVASHLGVSKSPHKLVLADQGAHLYIADGAAADVEVVDTKTFKVEKTIPLAPQPDSGVADRKSGIFYLGNGGAKSQKDSAYISLISLADGSVMGKIDVPAGQLKAMAIDDAGGRLFVNMRDKNQVGVIDLKTRKLSATWKIPGPGVNSAMAFDPATKRLFIGSRKPGKLFVLDAADGSVVQSLDIIDVSDEMIFDGVHKRLYIAGAGGLDVLRQIDKDHYAIQQHIDTLGGKTATYIPSLKKLYVVHTKGPQASEAGLQVFSVE